MVHWIKVHFFQNKMLVLLNELYIQSRVSLYIPSHPPLACGVGTIPRGWKNGWRRMMRSDTHKTDIITNNKNTRHLKLRYILTFFFFFKQKILTNKAAQLQKGLAIQRNQKLITIITIIIGDKYQKLLSWHVCW